MAPPTSRSGRQTQAPLPSLWHLALFRLHPACSHLLPSSGRVSDLLQGPPDAKGPLLGLSVWGGLALGFFASDLCRRFDSCFVSKRHPLPLAPAHLAPSHSRARQLSPTAICWSLLRSLLASRRRQPRGQRYLLSPAPALGTVGMGSVGSLYLRVDSAQPSVFFCPSSGTWGWEPGGAIVSTQLATPML